MKCFAIAFPIALAMLGCGAAKQPGEDIAKEEQAAAQPAASVADPEETEIELLPNARQPEADLLTGGQPSIEQLDRIAAAGYRTVINLRAPDEEGQLAASEYTSRGLAYQVMPIPGKDALDEANARAFSALLADRSLRPLVIHCGSGNRVGALFALEAFYVAGRPAEDALLVGRDAGLTRLEPVVRERLALPAEEEAAATP